MPKNNPEKKLIETSMLITFEGIDGSGKSTQIQLLKQWFDSQGISYVVFREPGSSSISEKIREILLDAKNEIHPVAEMLLFSAARAQLSATQIKPELEAGKVVLLDRFFNSTTAYQGYGRKAASLDAIEHLNSLASLGLVPDITFFLDIDYNGAQQRREGTQKDRMEQAGETFFSDVIQGFRNLSEKHERIIRLEAQSSVAEIHSQIVQECQKRFTHSPFAHFFV